MNGENGWAAYREMVRKDLERLTHRVETVAELVGKAREEIAGLKVKAGVWGLVGGMIPVAITLAYLAIRN